MLIQKTLSNHAALQLESHLGEIDGAFLDLGALIRRHMTRLEGNYMPRIQIEWEIRRRSGVYALSIDDIVINAKRCSPLTFSETLASSLTGHAKLDLEGPAQVYRMTNMPTHGRVFVDILAPSKGMAIARLGALLGMGLNDIMSARQRPITIVRLSSDTEMKEVARQALQGIGLA